MQLPVEVLKIFEITAMLTGAAYAVLAARRNRLCWIAGAVSSALAALLRRFAWSAHAVGTAGVFRRHVSVWLAALDSQRGAGRIARRDVAISIALDRGARRHGAVICNRAAARRRNESRVAAARFADHRIQPACHLAGGACETRKLVVLDRDRRSTGVPLLRARPAVPGVSQCVVHWHRGGGFVAWRRRLHAQMVPA